MFFMVTISSFILHRRFTNAKCHLTASYLVSAIYQKIYYFLNGMWVNEMMGRVMLCVYQTIMNKFSQQNDKM